MKNEAHHQRELLSVLWARIDESNENRERILSQRKGYTRKEIGKLKAELQRCEEIKQQNLKFYIENVKKELYDGGVEVFYQKIKKQIFTLQSNTL